MMPTTHAPAWSVCDVSQAAGSEAEASPFFGLSALPRELKAFTGGETIPYRQAYHAVVNGVLPASRTSTGRWMISRSDLPEIAEILGLVEGE